MIPKPIDQIAQADVQNLIDNHVLEGKTIEYKRELPGNSDNDKIKLLRAISAFANTEGGDLLYGVEAEDGAPIAVPGIGNPNQDEVKLRIEAICRDGLEPRLPNMFFRFVPAQEGQVMVIRVPKSWLSPHRVKFNAHGHFYARGAGGVYQLDVGEIRTAFTMSQGIEDRIREFRLSRNSRIHQGDTPVLIRDGCKMVLHLMPLSAFAASGKIDIARHHILLRNFLPLGTDQAQRDKINLDGVLNYTNPVDGRSRAYTQIFRNGIVEAVAVFVPGDDGVKRIHSKRYEDMLLASLDAYLNLLKQFEVAPPLYLFLSFIGLQEYVFAVPIGAGQAFGFETARTSEYAIALPEIVITDYGIPVSVLLRPVFDMVWNAFGYPASQNYDAQGNRVP